MPTAPRRVFLDWAKPFLPGVAGWLLEQQGTDLDGLVVAVPGSRAARALVEHLARQAGPELVPPRVLTQGELVDELVLLELPIAGRMARTLAWSRALRDLEPEELDALVAHAPASAREWLRLAEVVRALHGELAPEGIAFADVARGAHRPRADGEARRWDALARAQELWRVRLARAGVCDPHEGRLAAIEAGRVDARRAIVLAGVADMNRLLRRLLERCAERTSVLVCASEADAGGFDAFGALDVAFWKERAIPIALERWHVGDKPVDQAELALRCIERWNGRYAPEEIAIGAADDEVVPALERQLAEQRVLARPAAGIPFAGTRPERFLALAGELVAARSFAAWAAFVRQPDVERCLWRDDDAAGQPARVLDDYAVEHLPLALPDPFLRGEQDLRRELERARAAGSGMPGAATAPTRHERLTELARGTRALLGELWTARERPLRGWSAPVRAALTAAFDVELRPASREDDRVVARALEVVAQWLDEVETLPAALDDEPVDAAHALEVLLAGVSAQSIPARTPAAGEGALELLGWLELALDGARALVVTGFNEGFVPRRPARETFLPDALRAALGIAHDAQRLARDVYAASILCAAREELDFISGRRSRDGDPLLPSRLVFQRPRGEIPARVRRFHSVMPHSPAAGGRPAPQYVLPRRSAVTIPERMSVTSFREYLRSPYAYYLRYVLRLETLDDRARELDPLAFGTLAHDVLADFGGDRAARELEDARKIADFLHGRLATRAAARYSTDVQPAVLLQIERLKRRLEFFAAVQAERRRAGWCIREVEWAPAVPITLDVDGVPVQLAGRIDRIDVRESEEGLSWAILDYKTGEEVDEPGKAHCGSNGVWRDLQLPLYTLLAQPLGFESPPQLGYFALGKDADNCHARFAAWNQTQIAAALEAARGVVRSVREGKFFELGRGVPRDEIFEAIAGVGVLAGEADGEDSEAGSEAT